MRIRSLLRGIAKRVLARKYLTAVLLLAVGLAMLFVMSSCMKPVTVPTTTHSVTGGVEAPPDLPYWSSPVSADSVAVGMNTV